MKKAASQILTEVVESLSLATSLSSITDIVAKAGRALTNSDGATFVLMDGPNCFYADENSIAPLWKGKRFPLDACISGWCMRQKQVVVISDIYADARIPHDAYRPTFVKSLCMVPVRAEDPIAAIGNYWANGYVPTEEDIKHLTILANSAAIAIENFQLKETLKNYNTKIFEPSDSEIEHQFETAIHSLAHDLRNPLSTMMLFAEMLRGRVG
ncbi:MAG: GAF domain-containing protein, partial [Proteobacteria bacterium]